MNVTELATLSMSELKSFCTANSIEVVGDKRSKATYINAIESFQSLQIVTDFETEQPIDLPLMEAAETAERSTTPLDLYMESDGSLSSPLPTDLPTAPNTKYGAAIVLLIPLILLSVAVITIRIGITTLTSIIAAVGQFTISIWRSVTHTYRGTSSIPIDYFPA
jgi:hypothetical protein